MLQSEFKERTGVDVSFDEYQAIEKVYMESDLNKDDFCNMWCKMNSSRIKAAKKELAEKKAKARETEKLLGIINKIDRKLQKIRHDFSKEPLTVNFLREREISFLIKHGIKMNISYREAVDYGYSCPRHYLISETSYHIKKYLKIV